MITKAWILFLRDIHVSNKLFFDYQKLGTEYREGMQLLNRII